MRLNSKTTPTNSPYPSPFSSVSFFQSTTPKKETLHQQFSGQHRQTGGCSKGKGQITDLGQISHRAAYFDSHPPSHFLLHTLHDLQEGGRGLGAALRRQALGWLPLAGCLGLLYGHTHIALRSLWSPFFFFPSPAGFLFSRQLPPRIWQNVFSCSHTLFSRARAGGGFRFTTL